MEKVGAKNAIDIFCGKHHSFYIDKDHKVYAFGMNNHG
jgi:alpha-tubulin suppressor-like RCC1 family protein